MLAKNFVNNIHTRCPRMHAKLRDCRILHDKEYRADRHPGLFFSLESQRADENNEWKMKTGGSKGQHEDIDLRATRRENRGGN
jgi:hypothetical protein